MNDHKKSREHIKITLKWTPNQGETDAPAHTYIEQTPPNKTLRTLVTHFKPSLLRLVPLTLGCRRALKGWVLPPEKGLNTRKSVHNDLTRELIGVIDPWIAWNVCVSIVVTVLMICLSSTATIQAYVPHMAPSATSSYEPCSRSTWGDTEHTGIHIPI